MQKLEKGKKICPGAWQLISQENPMLIVVGYFCRPMSRLDACMRAVHPSPWHILRRWLLVMGLQRGEVRILFDCFAQCLHMPGSSGGEGWYVGIE